MKNEDIMYHCSHLQCPYLIASLSLRGNENPWNPSVPSANREVKRELIQRQPMLAKPSRFYQQLQSFDMQ